jgi:opacity protein-like surface antigen
MKKQIMIAALLLAAGLGTAVAEDITPPKFWVMPAVGLRGSGSFKIQSVELAYSNIRFSNGPSYGLSFGYRPSGAIAFEAIWSRLDTSVEGTAPGDDENPPVNEALFKASEDQFLANILLSTGYTIGAVKPYFLLGVGLTSVNPKADIPGVTHFAWNLGFGIEAYFKGRFGLRAQGKFVPTYVNTTDEILQEWNGGAITTASPNTMTQWELQAGFFFRF